MAKKEEAPKVVLERSYIIPLRRETLKVPPHKKAKKAVKAIREFVSKHLKSSDIKIGKYLNLKLWEHGMKNPPGKVKVTAAKDDKGKVFVELEGAPKEQPKAEEKKEAKAPSKKEEKTVKEAEFKEHKQSLAPLGAEKPAETKSEEAKKIEKEEIKELQKEHPKHHAPKMPQVQKSQQTHPTAPKSV